MKVGRPRTRDDRDIWLGQLWHKLARSVYAIVDYDLCLHKYKPKLSKSDVSKLKKACSQAIDAALKIKKGK